MNWRNFLPAQKVLNFQAMVAAKMVAGIVCQVGGATSLATHLSEQLKWLLPWPVAICAHWIVSVVHLA